MSDTWLWLLAGWMTFAGYLLGRRSARRPPAAPAGTTPQRDLHAYAESLPDGLAHPSELLEHPSFRAGVSLLREDGVPLDTLLDLALGANERIACLALDALCSRSLDDGARTRLLQGLAAASPFEQFFFLRALHAAHGDDQPILGPALLAIARVRDPGWMNFPPFLSTLRTFAQERLTEGEAPRFGEELAEVSEDVCQHVKQILERLALEGLQPLALEIETHLAQRLDRGFLQGFGVVWTDETPESAANVIDHERLRNDIAAVCELLESRTPRSVVLVGEPGVGKSVTARGALRQLQSRSWVVFEASSTDLVAGMSYIGQLEDRLTRLVQQMARPKHVILLPDLPQLLWAGSHVNNPSGVLDALMPALERGELLIVGEAEPGAWERLAQHRPRCRGVMQTVTLNPLPEDATLELARRWVAAQPQPASGESLADEATLQDALEMAQLYFGDMAAPGNVLRFLESCLQPLRSAHGEPQRRLRRADLVNTLVQRTGLPASMVDDRLSLDLEAARRYFESRVLGQPEALDCLLERITMIKAGLNDPGRPAGVFLLAGPTGTGKTELAKTLAAYLFGSPDRMIRLDMSELQTPDSLGRIFGDGAPRSRMGVGASLVESIRKQPFSVVLLDEFEKAHPNVWDLFLQVFDDGRLSDPYGRTADFRQAMILLTSNLGASIPTGANLGFSTSRERFRSEEVTRTIDRTFRREFVNRIDRIVVLHPLNRETMHEILLKELREVFKRRGLRNRNWAVEWDETALSFLLEKGFTHDLGARPLRRAIDRYVLAPLAATIVAHRVPQGDQFLFVKAAGDHLEVDFVDPDAPEEPGIEPDEAAATTAGEPTALHPAAIALHPRGTVAEMQCLRGALENLQADVHSEVWDADKQAHLGKMASAEFWRSAERHAVLGHVEYMDRIGAGLKRSASLLERLDAGDPASRNAYPRHLVQRLAQQLFLLERAVADVMTECAHDAYVQVEAVRGAGIDAAGNDEAARRIGQMYLAWARKRGMRVEVLEEGDRAGDGAYRMLLAVDGYGAYSLLAHETGLHVFEEPSDGPGSSVHRRQARVLVVAQPDEPADLSGDVKRHTALLHHARRVLARAQRDEQPRIVRRYREVPSPLVRDAVAGWRSGRLDRVLDGDFDLVAACEGSPSPTP